jgi:hypothetical protein
MPEYSNRGYTCICVPRPLPQFPPVYDTLFQVIPTQIIMPFPLPNIGIWSRMQAQRSLVVYTGHNNQTRILSPPFFPWGPGMDVVGFEHDFVIVRRRVGNIEQGLF